MAWFFEVGRPAQRFGSWHLVPQLEDLEPIVHGDEVTAGVAHEGGVNGGAVEPVELPVLGHPLVERHDPFSFEVY